MTPRSLLFIHIAVAALGAGCTKESVVEVPAGHGGLVCSNDGRPESCGLWLHDPGKLVIREDERLRLIDCSPFVREHHTLARVRDGVEIDVASTASFDVKCTRYGAREAFSLVEGDVGSDHLFAIYAKQGLDGAVRLASTAYLSHEIAKEPERLLDLAAGIVGNSGISSGPLTLTRYMVTSISLRGGDGEPKSVYDIKGE